MNFLHAILNLVEGKPQQPQRTLATVPEPPARPASKPTDSQVAQMNAQIAADGARMFQTAHPGQTYRIGQNGETYPGGVDMATYNALMRRPMQSNPFAQTSHFAIPAPVYRNPNLGVNTAPVQGLANPGYTPLQATHSFATGIQPASYTPIQGSSPQLMGSFKWQ